ncbi:nad-p-binding protein [Colletotrichum incanum]|uniref:Nad-p-binding protein n=1 Tax=Colletotrichum incanum TaxID=1573173 RepID=A0A162N1P4_COLIC|nr:nad-p-binding protein [Colletotrichum incanum]
MALKWLRRLCIRAADPLFGAFLYVPLGILFFKRLLGGFGNVEWDSTMIPDLHGKVAIVTGGNSAGIGYHTVRQLAAKGAKVYLAARSEYRAKEAIKRLLNENPSIPKENLVWLPLGLSSQTQVDGTARQFLAKTERLDILVNNAGLDPYNYVRTADGFEMTMAVKLDNPRRISELSSSGKRNNSRQDYFTSLEDLNDPCASPGWEDSCLAQGKRYGTSKLANILVAKELQRRMDEEMVSINSLSVDPGTIRTERAANMMPFVVRPLVWLLFIDAAKGADATMFAATVEEVKRDSDRWRGHLLDGPGVIKTSSPKARNVVTARNLWNTTAAAVQNTGALDGI